MNRMTGKWKVLYSCRVVESAVGRNLKRLRAASSSSPKSTAVVMNSRQEEVSRIRSQPFRRVLEALMTSEPSVSGPNLLRDWDSFLLHRMEGNQDLFEDEVKTSDVSKRVLSSLLTFPLTLAFGLSNIFPPQILSKENIQVLILGARDESSLSYTWWKEALFPLELVSSLKIEMIGPELVSKWDNQAVKLKSCDRTIRLRSPKDNKILLHNHPSQHQKLLNSDVYVLFNPGFGASDVMKEKWTPSLRILLQTRKPILLTAHCKNDLSRDLEFLEKLAKDEDEQELNDPLESIMIPKLNPFGSLSESIDKNESQGGQVISFNKYIYAIRSK